MVARAGGVAKLKVMELEQPGFDFKPQHDARGRMEQPLPVELEAIANVRGPLPKCALAKMDELYVDILEFAPLGNAPAAYRAENFTLSFDLPEVDRASYRLIRVIVRSLVTVVKKLVEAQIEYSRQKGIMPGQDALVFEDPDGNWLEVRQRRTLG